ncbi:MAG TPA: hypothetical protein VFF24_14860 [Acidimicrobiia bacterium]|nr:hypothetical protein [Acidimicrobiia bacterium]
MTDLAWPAAFAMALLVATVPRPAGIEGIVLGGGALVALPAAMYVGTSADWFATSGETLPAAMTLVTGAVLFAAAALLPTVRPWCRVLVVPALAFGVPAAAALSPVGMAVLGGAAAVAAAWFVTGAVVPLAALAVAATAVPDGLPAALLLAAAAVLAAPFPGAGSSAAALGLPGAAALAAAVAGGPVSIPRVLMTLAVAATAVLLVMRPRPAEGGSLSWWFAPAAIVGLWLVVAPGTWGWVGDAGLGHWDFGAVLALTAAGIAVVAVRGSEARR